jgi:hypothetical protein
MKWFGVWLGTVLLISAPAAAQTVHLNCPPQSGQGIDGVGYLFSIDFSARTVTISEVDRAGLVQPSLRQRWPATITDEIIYTQHTGRPDHMGRPVWEKWTINRYSATVRMDCGQCSSAYFYGPCAQERAPERRRQF